MQPYARRSGPPRATPERWYSQQGRLRRYRPSQTHCDRAPVRHLRNLQFPHAPAARSKITAVRPTGYFRSCRRMRRAARRSLSRLQAALLHWLPAAGRGSLLRCSCLLRLLLSVSALRGSAAFGFASATTAGSTCGFGFGAAAVPVADGAEPRSCIAESAAAICVFEPKKPPENLARQRLAVVVGDRDGWRLRRQTVRARRRHACRRNAAADLRQEHAVHTAIEAGNRTGAVHVLALTSAAYWTLVGMRLFQAPGRRFPDVRRHKPGSGRSS